MSAAADSDFLQQMAAAARERDTAARRILSDAQQRSLLTSATPTVPLLLPPGQFDVLAELKKRSPAEGTLDDQLVSPVAQAAAYADGGAVALSVLTEPEQFHGSLDDLHAVALANPDLPVMRKDFLVSRYQVREARLAGASGVLLIAAMLDQDQLEAMVETAYEQGLFVLMEIFDQADLDNCVPVLERFGPALDAASGRCNYLLGVNCRDLRSLQVNFAHFAHMAPALPDGMPWVAESGVTEASQVGMLVELGYRVALVGTALMRSGDPAATIAAWREAGSTACL